MSTTTTTTPILTRQNVEDLLLAVLPILAGPTGTAVINLSGFVPGIPGFVLAVIIASLVKSAIGINADNASYEDWLNFVITLVGAIGAGLTGNSSVALYGVVLGFIAKALPSLADGLNIEDGALVLGAVLAGIGGSSLVTGSDATALTNLGLLIATLGKAWPSLANGGGTPTPSSSASTSTTPAAPAATPGA
jgi:hypothetical protein